MVDARGHTCLTVTRDRQYVPAMTPTLVTADQLEHLRLPDKHVELVKGVLIVKEPAGYRHGAVAARLAKVLMDYADAQELGQVVAAETGFTLATDPDTVRAPDIAFIGRKRVPSAGLPDKFWSGPPDLAVEVLSPDDTVYEVEEKVDEWLSAGAQAVWVVNPRKQTVVVHRLQAPVRTFTAKDRLDGEDVLPGFSCDLAKVFPKD